MISSKQHPPARGRAGIGRVRWQGMTTPWAIGLALLMALIAAGCGPGLGGTGTGDSADALAAYGAREVPVCSAEFADLLGCTTASPGAGPQPASGARFFAEASPASRVLLEIDGQEAQLRLRCLDRVFIGRFGQVGTATPAFYGQVIEGGSRAQLASVQLERSGTGLSATLFDAAGRAIAGPQALQAVAGATSEAPCP